MQKAADYVADYEQRFQDVAAAETCERLGRAADGSATSSSRRSLVVFAMLPGEVPWLVLREPAEGPDAGRLERLFREAPGQAARAALALEDAPDPQVQLARPRTPPTLALAVLRPENRDRYRFERRGARTIGGAATVEIAFTETGTPTQLVDLLGRALPSSGRLFVREADGAVLRSELAVGTATKLEAVAEYGSDPALGILVPTRLRETITSGMSTAASARPPISRGRAGEPALGSEDRLRPQAIELSTRYEQFRRLAVPWRRLAVP